MKICTKCKQEKSYSNFWRAKWSKDGFNTVCITCGKLQQKSWRDANKDKYLEYHRNWREKNREEYRERWNTYRKNNKDKAAARESARRARKTQATPPWLTDQHNSDMMSMYSLAKKLEKLTGVSMEVDHIVPLKGKTVCGLHVPWNLQVLEKRLNRSKGCHRWPNMWGV